MKFNFTLLVFFSALLFSINSSSQDISSTVQGGEYKFNGNKTACLTDVERTAMLNDIRTNISQLRTQNRLVNDNVQNRAVAHPLFSWPVKMKDGTPYNEVWSISNYVDQNSAFPNKLLDYNCGTKSYDTKAGYNHMGVDIYSWPFPWKMMENDEVEVIAAAPGQIIGISRGHLDRNCEMDNSAPNRVIVQHADGSAAVYMHMKKNSPTSKVVGDTVERGEYLGIVGSSGSSSGPHLHFEVYSEIEWKGVGKDVLVDPYAGDCNSMNSDSWWQEQKPYLNPKINAVLTHTNIPIYPDCPQQETTYESNDFDAKDLIHFGIFLRDQVAGSSINLRIIRPDNSILYNWNYTLVDYYSSSWWMWYYSGVYNMNGQWKWQATYQGQTVTHHFNVSGVLGVDEENFSATSVYPNPFKNSVHITSNSVIKKTTITDVLGKRISVIHNPTEGIKEITLESLSKGLYFLTLEGDANQKKIIKLIKE